MNQSRQIWVSDAEGAAHTGLGLSMGLATTRLATYFAMELDSIDDILDENIDQPRHPHLLSWSRPVASHLLPPSRGSF